MFLFLYFQKSFLGKPWSCKCAADVPYFLLTIAPNSRATIRHLKDWEACEGDGQKVCANNFNFFFLVEVNWFVILGMLFWWIIGIIYQNGYSWCFFLKQLDIIFAVAIWFLWSMSSSKPPRLASSQLPRTYFNEMETQVSSLFMLQREPWFHRSGLVPCWWSIDYSTTR